MKALLCLVVLGVAPALAQQEVPEQVAPVKAVPTPQVTLATALDQLDWEPSRRGALLLVAPERLVLEGKTPLPPPRNGYGLPELVGYFDQQVVRFSTLTSAGPTQITELHIPAAVPDLIQEFFRQTSPSVFLASLSPSQLQRAATTNGLGYSDLTDERQRELWEKIFPATLDFRGSTTLPPGLAAGQTPWYDKKSLPVLSPAAQRTFRIQLSTELALNVQPGGYTTELRESPAGSLHVALRRMPISPDNLPEYQREQSKSKSGMRKVPYRRKPSDLDLSDERLAVPISLDDAKTVGEVVQRAAQALRLELYADARLASLSVFVRLVPGQKVSAADALNAILRATATTVRRLQVGQSVAFVISYDRVPLGNTSVALFDGLLPQEMGEMQEEVSRLKAKKLALGKLRQSKLLTTLPHGVASQVPEALWQAAREGKSTARFSVSELPAAVGARVQADWSARQRYPDPDGDPPPKPPQSVSPLLSLQVRVLCPSLGEASLGRLSVEELIPLPEVPLVVLPETIKTRGLRVRPPKSAAEAKQLMAQAKARSFTVLYLALSGDANDDRGVGFLAAEKDALPLVPTLSPLMPGPTDTQRERDISMTGRTTAELAQGRPALGAIAQIIPYIVPLFEQITRLDALTPEAVPVERFTERVARLAALPGVVQIGLYDTVALGYQGSQDRTLETLWTGGYSAAERLAFLRAKGIDPSDFFDVNGLSSTGQFKLPFFSEDALTGTLRSAWDARRKARADQLQKRLEEGFQLARMTKPVQKLSGGLALMGTQQWKIGKGSVGPVNLPYWEAMINSIAGVDSDSPDENSSIRRWLTQRLTLRPAAANPELLEGLPGSRAIPAAGFVYDLADLSLAQALAHLEVIIAAKN